VNGTVIASEDTGEERRLTSADCRACGACCSFSHSWPRFTLEEDAEIELIPPAFIAEDGSGMRCIGDRCSALIGRVGVSAACGIYSVRPDVCRACQPGDDECLMARAHYGL
jgi:uncharacterized protein